MDVIVVLLGIQACVYSLIIGLPRIRRELSAGETRACFFVVLLSLLVLGFNVTKDTHPQIAGWLVLIELALMVGIIGFRVVRLVARMRMRQSG